MFSLSKYLCVLACGLSLTLPLSTAEASAGAPSQDALAKEVLSGISSKDSERLERLAITEDEFKRYVWPTVASHVAGADMSAGKFYTIYRKSSTGAIQSSIQSFSGKSWQIVSISAGTQKKDGKGYRLFDAPTITIRESSGEERTVKLIGGVLERNGSFKATTYYVTPQQQK